MSTPTQRTLAHLRGLGYLAVVVERWNPHAGVRQDLYGIVDVLAVKSGETVGVQATSGSNVAARLKKITEHENLPKLREAGWRLLIHGWAKKRGRWTLRELDLS